MIIELAPRGGLNKTQAAAAVYSRAQAWRDSGG